jgi:flagellar biosynthetic protein FlhB
MADDGSGEKTEEPTSKKLDDAKKKGQVWKSKDLSGVAVFLAGMGTLKASWDWTEDRFRGLFVASFDYVAHAPDMNEAVYKMMHMALNETILLTVPVLVGAMVLGGLTEYLQVGSIFALESVQPKLEKLNPIEGLKNLFSKKQLVELLKSSGKIAIASYVVWGVMKGAMPMVVETIRGGPEQMKAAMGELVFRTCVRVGLLFILFSVFDVWWQHRVFMKDLMMTKDEVKREYKESEGDPHHKAKRKEFHMEILEGAQMEAVRGADVVVTNPDHVAIALKYDKDKDQAPRVLAKGLDSRAEAMKAIARQSDVTMVRNVPLAHALYRVEVGQDIPEALYDAVAEVLNFVYSLKQGTTPPSA